MSTPFTQQAADRVIAHGVDFDISATGVTKILDFARDWRNQIHAITVIITEAFGTVAAGAKIEIGTAAVPAKFASYTPATGDTGHKTVTLTLADIAANEEVLVKTTSEAIAGAGHVVAEIGPAPV